MCGIAGFVLRDQPADVTRVRAMCDQIRHRGPDDEGFHVDGGCALGMRRLSIIDLSTGHQPISNEDGSIWVVFNGEIYDYRGLTRELRDKGHRFRTVSDTETLVHLYEEEGERGIAKLRGMFAFAIWDSRRRRLLLARDRFGKKPLYYAVLPEGIYFGSELKCLREAGVPLDLDEDALKYYFQFSYIPDPFTPYKAIRKLLPGSWLTYDISGEFRTERYWSLPAPASQPPGESYESACGEIRSVFDEAVRIRMISDVPLGAFLSGGIDSSLVVASMATQSSEPVKTFSIGFEEQSFNETGYARMVAEKYKTDHREILVRPDAIGLIERLVRHFDEPFGDSSAIPTLMVSEATRQYVKVALSGDGGDEMFAGYESFFLVDRLRKLDAVPQAARKALAGVAQALPYSARGKNWLRMISRPAPLDRYFELNYAPRFLRERLLRPEWMLPDSAASLKERLPWCFVNGDSDILTQTMYWEATAKLAGDMLVKVDRMSMAASLEVRSPLLDTRLAEIAMRIPHSWKMKDGRGKRILIDSMKDRLPAELLTRPKMGFGVPLAAWFRTSLREMLWDTLDAPAFHDRGIVERGFVKYLLEEHDTGRRDNSHWLWGLLMFELWFQDLRRHAPQPAGALR